MEVFHVVKPNFGAAKATVSEEERRFRGLLVGRHGRQELERSRWCRDVAAPYAIRKQFRGDGRIGGWCAPLEGEGSERHRGKVGLECEGECGYECDCESAGAWNKVVNFAGQL